MYARIQKAAVVLAIASSALVTAKCAAADRPNIIYIMADDLGYGDLGCFGSKLNDTPNIDALAAGGLRLTDFHAAAWCAPSRRALMTGCHAFRPWSEGQRKWSRLARAVTIPEMLGAVGYETAIIGKWHLEMGEGLHPLDQGFDYWYGTRGSNDWDGPRPNYASFRDAPEEAWKTPLYINRENKGPVVPQSLFTKRYTEECVRLINNSGDSPFFIYLAHNMPHVPIFASEAFQGKSRNGVFGDVVAEIDWSVGEIVNALRGRELVEKTIVVFTSDNGPWSMFNEFGGVADPLRGEKSTTWEGGERVPCVVSWPTHIKPGENGDLMVNHDIYATFATITGTTIPDGHAIDSIDMSGVFLRRESGQRQKHVYYFRQPMAYRSGNYKLHAFTRERTRNPETGSPEPSVKHDPEILFDVRADIGERRNIAAENPAIVARLKKEFAEARTAIAEWRPF